MGKDIIYKIDNTGKRISDNINGYIEDGALKINDDSVALGKGDLISFSGADLNIDDGIYKIYAP